MIKKHNPVDPRLLEKVIRSSDSLHAHFCIERDCCVKEMTVRDVLRLMAIADGYRVRFGMVIRTLAGRNELRASHKKATHTIASASSSLKRVLRVCREVLSDRRYYRADEELDRDAVLTEGDRQKIATVLFEEIE